MQVTSVNRILLVVIEFYKRFKTLVSRNNTIKQYENKLENTKYTHPFPKSKASL